MIKIKILVALTAAGILMRAGERQRAKVLLHSRSGIV